MEPAIYVNSSSESHFNYVSRKSERKNTSALAVENLNPNIDICHRIKRFVVKPQSCTFTRLKGSHYSPRRADLFNPSNSQRSEEHTSELQSLMRITYAVFCLKKKNTYNNISTSSKCQRYKKSTKSH